MAVDSNSPSVLLEQAQAGDDEAQAKLFTYLCQELHGLAYYLMQGQPNDHTLQPTALLHEALLRILGTDTIRTAPNCRYLIASVAEAMRRVLIDHARRRKSRKRGGDWQRVPLDDHVDHFQTLGVDVLVLTELMEKLREKHERWYQVILLRYFVGFTNETIALQLDVKLPTVEKDLHKARAWLERWLSESPE